LGKLSLDCTPAGGDGADFGAGALCFVHPTRQRQSNTWTQRKSILFMIELFNVSKQVPSGSETLTILHSLNLTIPDGQFISIVGPSGSGKSTLLGLIAGLDAPTAGDIRIDNESIVSMGEDDLARLRGKKIGFVFQSFHLIPSLTAFENVLVPMEIAGVPDAADRARQLLLDVDLTARASHYPSQLSGGEQQRVAIARAFANDPSILLADEPTGNLDSYNGRHIFDLMVEIHQRRSATLILVTHDHNLAEHADRSIALSDGRVIADRIPIVPSEEDRRIAEVIQS
jgi:putative ABC transport system ATP-binding protein